LIVLEVYKPFVLAVALGGKNNMKTTIEESLSRMQNTLRAIERISELPAFKVPEIISTEHIARIATLYAACQMPVIPIIPEAGCKLLI